MEDKNLQLLVIRILTAKNSQASALKKAQAVEAKLPQTSNKQTESTKMMLTHYDFNKIWPKSQYIADLPDNKISINPRHCCPTPTKRCDLHIFSVKYM